ncbi:MAG: hypothetical protein FJ395_01695 [Verrucomicrobia bacterium]|nr:hypothetical protein [Verrucomicrobiota bacterium]
MTLQKRKRNPLAEIVRSQLEEINKYKWIESEKFGRDIGMERAAREWMAKHFPDWKQYRWKQAIAEALRQTDVGLN